MDESTYIQSRSDDAAHADPDGNIVLPVPGRGGDPGPPDATTDAIPSSDFISAAAKCSAQPTTRHSSCVPHPTATIATTFYSQPSFIITYFTTSQAPPPSEPPQPKVPPHSTLARWFRRFEAISKRRWWTLSANSKTLIQLQPFPRHRLLPFHHNHYWCHLAPRNFTTSHSHLSHTVALVHPTPGTTTVRILSFVWTKDLSLTIAVHLVYVPSRLMIPCKVIHGLLIHHEKALSGYAPGREHLHHPDDLGMNIATDGNPNPTPVLKMILAMVGQQKTPAATKTNNMAGTMVNMTDGVNTVNPTITTTTTHSPIKSVSMRHSPPPRPSPLRPIPPKNLPTTNNIIPKARRSLLALLTGMGTLRSRANPKIGNLIVLTVATHFKRAKSTSHIWTPLRYKLICAEAQIPCSGRLWTSWGQTSTTAANGQQSLAWVG